MQIFTALILGIIQGLTEFLPISSSGHLVVAQQLLPALNKPGVLLEVILHAGTIASILIFFRKRLMSCLIKYRMMIIVGTIPAAVAGIALSNHVDRIFGNLTLVGLAFLFTATLNILLDSERITKFTKLTDIKLAVAVGIAQAVAIIPGISRSGSTIFTGNKFGFSRKQAAEFSFLLSIPAVAGANILEFFKADSIQNYDLPIYFVGFLSALISGLFAIKLVYRFLEEKKFKYFGYYLFILAALVLIGS